MILLWQHGELSISMETLIPVETVPRIPDQYREGGQIVSQATPRLTGLDAVCRSDVNHPEQRTGYCPPISWVGLEEPKALC